VWTGWILLRIWTSDGLLWAQQRTIRFHKKWGNSWPAERPSVSREGLRCRG